MHTILVLLKKGALKKYDMRKAKKLLRKLFTPVTIMLIPHDSNRTINFKLPSVGIVSSVILWIVGSVYVISVAVSTVEYHQMKNKLSFYTAQFTQLESTIVTLKKAETEFERLLSFGTKNKILENVDTKVTAHDTGSIDMDMLQEQIRKTVESVGAIKDFLKDQKDIYIATPRGWPIDGRVTV